MQISMIVACAKNGVIGLDNKMPWHIKGDLKYFKAKTMGKPMIMGRNTFESMGKLPGRTSIVITRNRHYECDADVLLVSSMDEAILKATDIAHKDGVDEIMIVGGGQIYALGLGLADRLYITQIDTTPEGDAYFPTFDKIMWQETNKEVVKAQTATDSDYAFMVYDRV